MLRRGVITQSLCKNITLYLNQPGPPPASSHPQAPADPLNPKPLLLMLPWLGSRPQALAKYCETYFCSGFDVLMVHSNVRKTILFFVDLFVKHIQQGLCVSCVMCLIAY